MLNIVNDLFVFAEYCLSFAGDALHMVVSKGNEMLFVYALLPLVGLGVGFLGRLFHIAR